MVFSLRDFRSSLYGREQAQQNRFEIFLKCKLFTGESNRYVSLRAEIYSFQAEQFVLHQTITYMAHQENYLKVLVNMRLYKQHFYVTQICLKKDSLRCG